MVRIKKKEKWSKVQGLESKYTTKRKDAYVSNSNKKRKIIPCIKNKKSHA